ncbi:MAG: SAM-dependent chlorinase/fluorinase [Chloroflexota bacterium]|nr:SAM-dependent chlorinase/fluorinase [Chloroflexota bacterium]MDE2950403.1 SAM-dependent chlorinase/fluorinase [Chloroflexota bacterium]
MTKIAAILTDFGTQDTYVGTMKAVMLGIAPELQIVDITHAIGPQNVREGAFALLNSYRYFPGGTVFCAVVDPGVGSARKPIAARCAGYHFVAPDNGLLSYSLFDLDSEYHAVSLENPEYQLPGASHTFHGRDIFAPAAARLASDPACLKDMGPELDRIVTFPKPQLSYFRQRVTGEVMHIDHFGNIITSIGILRWQGDDELNLDPLWNGEVPELRLAAASANVTIHSHTIHGISRAYHEAQLGAILAQIDSNGFLEICANQESAADRLDIQLGDKVMLRLTS